MKPQHGDVTVQGNLGGVRTEMSIDQDALEHLMGVLTDLYGDPEQAVIREYSTNAYDSHIESGQTRPIEVSLPNAMSPVLVIRDFGVGLSVDQITGMYSKYGASTKRDSDEFNGTLGLGAKSALTYTNQFTMTSVKNGVKATVVVSRNENNVGVMEIVDTASTTEPNGVCITIPSRNFDSMRRKALEFFKYWPVGSVLVDGSVPERIDGHWITDKMVVVPSGDDTIVMGNVAYPLPSDFQIPNAPYRRHYGVVVFVEIGDVAFAPSREALRDNARTKAKIAEITKQIAPAMTTYFNSLVEKATTPAEAIKAVHDYENIVGRLNNPRWRGQDIKVQYDFRHWRWTPGRSRYATQFYTHITYNEVINKVIVLDYPKHLDSVSAPHRAKIRKWCQDNEHSYSTVFISEETAGPGAPWTDGSLITVSWEDVKKIKVDPKVRAGGRARTEKYDAINDHGMLVEVSDFDTDKILYYSPAEIRARYRRSDYTNRYQPIALRNMFPDHHIVCLSKNRWERFEKDWPTAKHVSAMAVEQMKILAKALDSDDLLRYSLAESGRLSDWTRVKDSDIIDPVLSDYLRVLRKKCPNLEMFNKACETLSNYFGVQPEAIKAPKIEKVWEKYPLFNRNHLRESIEYVNTIYNLRSENE